MHRTHMGSLKYAFDMCFKLLTSERALPHVSHVYSFNPECILTCLLRLLRTLKGLLHVSHSYGFSPVCILR